MTTRRILGVALAVALLALPAGLRAQQDSAESDPVVARVDGEAIRQSEVMAMAQNLPPQYRMQMAQIYPLLIQRLIDFKLASAAGRAAGLAEDDEVKARMMQVEDRVIRELYLTREIESRITPEELQERYQAFLEKNPPKIEHKARHILVETEDKAKEMIAQLDGGADFAELAKEHSTGPSGPQGGDLGYFSGDQMVPEFSAAAEKLEPGQHTAEPTKTQFGWHVIKLDDRRETAPPPFEEMQKRLLEEMSQEMVQVIFADLRDGAKVEIFSLEQPASVAEESAQ